MTEQSWTELSMTNYGSFHGCNVPAHASEELDVSGLESEDGFLQHGSTTILGEGL